MDQELANLAGIVVYTPEIMKDGRKMLRARWVSTRTVESGQVGTGQAIVHGEVAILQNRERVPPEVNERFVGEWMIEYFGPDGTLQVTPFLLELRRSGEIYLGRWADPQGQPLLNGFGFEVDGKLCMRYGANP